MKPGPAAIAVLALAGCCAAEEIVLRDGRRLKGTVTGFENGAFRLETDYGVVLVTKDRIARIEFAEETSPAARPVPPPPPPQVRERQAPGGRIVERVEGITYINDSFRFELFKPPTWKVLDQAAKGIPSAVAVLGTPDETTVLVVGSVLFEAPPAAYGRILDEALRRVYADFETRPAEPWKVDGRPAVRRAFRGTAGGHEWHGLVVNLANGSEHYGIIGITRDEEFRFKESVLSRVMNSFRFR